MLLGGGLPSTLTAFLTVWLFHTGCPSVLRANYINLIFLILQKLLLLSPVSKTCIQTFGCCFYYPEPCYFLICFRKDFESFLLSVECPALQYWHLQGFWQNPLLLLLQIFLISHEVFLYIFCSTWLLHPVTESFIILLTFKVWTRL